ncbi:MAG: hypothetical protein Q7S99_08750 [Parvibaculum sp.]|nr:hypothetical protein [Parvibaculum sp.]
MSEPMGPRLSLIVVIGLSLMLSACGFRPLYGDRGVEASTYGDLSGVTVSSPDTTIGRALKFDLLDTLNDSGDQPATPLYKLTLHPRNYSLNVAVQQDATVTRRNFVLVVTYTLRDIGTGKIIYNSTARARSSYNRVDSEFANLSAAADAEKRTAKAVAADIKTQVSVFFDRRARDGKTAMK